MFDSCSRIKKERKVTKKMKSKIIQYFKAEINTIVFNDEMNYNTTEYILGKIEEKFGEVYTDKFISELSYAIERVSNKTEDFSYSELEWDMIRAIDDAEKFETIHFYDPYIPSELNEDLAAGKFTK